MTTEPDDDLVPVSVRLGEVVPPEDPEDWTRPLTWVAALGMLAGPLVALGWFAVAAPLSGEPMPATYVLAAALAAGAAVTGSTQQGRARAWTATLGAGLFGALLVVVLGVVMAGERAVDAAPPIVAHAVAAAVAGLSGTVAASITAAGVADAPGRRARIGVPIAFGVAVALASLALLPRGEPATADQTRVCTARLAGATVSVSYPDSWWASGPADPAGSCLDFGAAGAGAKPDDARIELGAAGGGPQPVLAGETGRSPVDGRPAVRIESEGEGPGDQTPRTVTYNISLGDTLEDGPIIVAFTDSERPGSFAENVRVLDRMMQLIRIGPTP